MASSGLVALQARSIDASQTTPNGPSLSSGPQTLTNHRRSQPRAPRGGFNSLGGSLFEEGSSPLGGLASKWRMDLSAKFIGSISRRACIWRHWRHRGAGGAMTLLAEVNRRSGEVG